MHESHPAGQLRQPYTSGFKKKPLSQVLQDSVFQS